MPAINLHVGSFISAFVGDFTGSSVLTRINSIGTGEYILKNTVSEQYEPVAGNSVQTGFNTIELTCSFLNDDALSVNLARGLLVGDTAQNDGTPFNQYALLLVHPDDLAQASIFIPQCYTIKDLTINYQKNAPTKIDLKFVVYNRNRICYSFL